MYELRRLIHEFNTNHLFQKCIYQKYLLFPLNPGKRSRYSRNRVILTIYLEQKC